MQIWLGGCSLPEQFFDEKVNICIEIFLVFGKLSNGKNANTEGNLQSFTVTQFEFIDRADLCSAFLLMKYEAPIS